MYSWSRSPPLVLVSQGLVVGKDQTKGGILLTLIRVNNIPPFVRYKFVVLLLLQFFFCSAAFPLEISKLNLNRMASYEVVSS